MKPYSAVIFDMDGLMFDTERMSLDAFRKAALMYGFEETNNIFLQLIGKNVRDSDSLLTSEFGPTFPVCDVRATRKEILERMRQEQGVPMKNGLKELLIFLQRQETPMAIASSSDRQVVLDNIDQHQLGQYFVTYTCGDEIKNGKPDPEIFLTTAQKLNINPSQCIVFEDSYSGIKAARAAGMIPIMVPDLVPPTDEICSLSSAVCTSLGDAFTHMQANYCFQQ